MQSKKVKQRAGIGHAVWEKVSFKTVWSGTVSLSRRYLGNGLKEVRSKPCACLGESRVGSKRAGGK